MSDWRLAAGLEIGQVSGGRARHERPSPDEYAELEDQPAYCTICGARREGAHGRPAACLYLVPKPSACRM